MLQASLYGICFKYKETKITLKDERKFKTNNKKYESIKFGCKCKYY